MSAILTRLFVNTISLLLLTSAIISLLPGCDKNAQTATLKLVEQDTIIVHDTIVHHVDTTSILQDSIKDAVVPVPAAIKIISVTKTQVTISGSTPHSALEPVTEMGVCYGTHANVSISDNIAQASNLTDTFTINLSGLIPNTSYYARAYAKNAAGVGYSDEILFTTASDTIDLYNLTGSWMGIYVESSVIDGVIMRVQMNVTVNGDEFKGIITAVGLPDYPTRTLTGLINSDGTQLTLNPIGSMIFANPWTIDGNKIKGSLPDFVPTPPDTIIVKYRYEFTKQ